MISFNEQQLNRIFPFHIKLKNDFTIVGFGNSIGEMCKLHMGQSFFNCFLADELSKLFFVCDANVSGNVIRVSSTEFSTRQFVGTIEYLESSDEFLLLIQPEKHHSDERLLNLEVNLGSVLSNNLKDLFSGSYPPNVENAENEHLWKIALEESNYGVWFYYPNERIAKYSNRYKTLLGYSVEEHFDINIWLASIHNVDLNYFAQYVLPLLCVQEPGFVQEIRLKNKYGLYKYFQSSGKVIEWDKQGKPNILVGTLIDINDSKKKDFALKESNERLLSLINNFNSGVLFERNDRTLILVNKRFCELMSLKETPEMLTGTNCKESLAVGKGIFQNPDQFETRVNQIIDEKLKVVEEIVYMQDGNIYLRDFIPLDGAYLWIYRDVTEKKKYEVQLKMQQEYYQSILDEVPAEIVISGRDQKFRYISKSAVKDESTRNWLIGKDSYDYCRLRNFDVKLADLRSMHFEETVAKKIPARFVEEHKLPDGSILFMLRILYPIMDNEQEVDYVIGYGINITEQIKNERFAEVQERRIRNLLEIIKDGVFRCDENGVTNLYNDSFLRILESGGKHFANGESISLFDLLSVEDLRDVKEKIQILKDNGTSQFGVFKMATIDGDVKYLDYTFTSAIQHGDSAYVGRISDVTASVNKERDLKRIIQQEQLLNDSKSQFVRITSHELRTPLAIILANAEILEMLIAQSIIQNGNEKVSKAVGRIIKEVTIMTEILNQLMTISKIESGNIEFNLEPILVKDFLENLKLELYEPHTDGRNLELAVDENVERVLLDKKLIRHAIVNLVSNAFKYSAGKRAPVLKVTRTGGNVAFEVQDFGIGIPVEDRSKIFQSFFRASNVGGIQGTGLGLMVLDYAVKKHGGQIYFESELNIGSKFRIVIPESNTII